MPPDHQGLRFPCGTRLGPYRLLQPLGQGACGEVWLAERASTLTQSRLAVKLPLAAAIDLGAVRQEAEIWIRAAGHPNLLPIFEADVYDGQVVIVSEYAPDGSLKEWLASRGGKAPSFEVAVDLGMGILGGLEHLHVRGVIHRDLKPANILMQGECPRIADFGLARLGTPGEDAGRAAGTPAYMAPEAFDGVRSVQTDVWSVGVILYQMLAGRLPFPGEGLLEILKATTSKAPPELPGEVPGAVASVVWNALEKNPGSRYRSAADMRAALRDALRQLEAGGLSAGFAPRRGCLSVAVTGSMGAKPSRVAHRLRALAAPYLGDQTTWYCGTVGAVDEAAIEYLLGLGQRVIAVGYGAADVSQRARAALDRHGAPFVDAQGEAVPAVPGAPSERDIFFSTKADLVLLLWDGQSKGTAELLAWLRRVRKDHVVGFV